MRRTEIPVRDAVPEDVPELLELWAEVRELRGRIERPLPEMDAEDALGLLRQVAADPTRRCLVAARSEGPIVGVALLSTEAPAPFLDAPYLRVQHLHVRRDFRRRGVGRTLVAAAAAFAEDRGVDRVALDVPAPLRDTQRFYAGLGFAPVVVRRTASVAALRRRLAPTARARAAAPHRATARLAAPRRGLIRRGVALRVAH